MPFLNSFAGPSSSSSGGGVSPSVVFGFREQASKDVEGCGFLLDDVLGCVDEYRRISEAAETPGERRVRKALEALEDEISDGKTTIENAVQIVRNAAQTFLLISKYRRLFATEVESLYCTGHCRAGPSSHLKDCIA